MTKVKPKTKEQTIDFMIKYLSLGTYDKKFLSNVLQLNIAVKKPVTTNQADLLNKIIVRYHKQLAKKEIDSKEIISLPWTLPPIQSSPQYTNAHLSIEDDLILLRTPYKKEFVKELKDIPYMNWDRETKTWKGPKAEFILKKLINLIDEHFTNVNYSENIKSIIDILCEYESVKFWQPTLTIGNGNLYIAAATPELMDAITFIPLSLEPHIVARLVRMGVNIDPVLITDELSNVVKTNIDKI